MPIPTPEVRAKIAASLRAYYANPDHQAKHRETSRAGGRAVTSRKASLEAENARLRREVEQLRAELASREPDSASRSDARPWASEVTGDPTTGRGDGLSGLDTPSRGDLR